MNEMRRLAGIGLVLAVTAAAAGCGDDESQGTGGATTTTPGTGGGGTTTSPGAGGGGAGGGGNTGGGGGAPSDCDALPAGPIDPVVVLTVLDGSEDLAFDGKGRIAAKQGNNVVLVDAAQQVTNLAALADTAYGLRYRPDGNLVVARPQPLNTVVEISPAGVVTTIAMNLGGPNGLYPDFDGNVWMTEFNADRVSRINPDNSVDTIVSGNPEVNSPNGIVFDPTRMLLFYTNYGPGEIMKVNMAPGGDITPVLVTAIDGTSLDGLVLDACGNLYVVDQANSELYRVKLDALGAATGGAELLASFQENVANAQFGSGPGFDPKTLYVAGVPGVVYAVAAGVAGAPVPTPP